MKRLILLFLPLVFFSCTTPNNIEDIHKRKNQELNDFELLFNDLGYYHNEGLLYISEKFSSLQHTQTLDPNVVMITYQDLVDSINKWSYEYGLSLYDDIPLNLISSSNNTLDTINSINYYNNIFYQWDSDDFLYQNAFVVGGYLSFYLDLAYVYEQDLIDANEFIEGLTDIDIYSYTNDDFMSLLRAGTFSIASYSSVYWDYQNNIDSWIYYFSPEWADGECKINWKKIAKEDMKGAKNGAVKSIKNNHSKLVAFFNILFSAISSSAKAFFNDLFNRGYMANTYCEDGRQHMLLYYPRESYWDNINNDITNYLYLNPIYILTDEE